MMDPIDQRIKEIREEIKKYQKELNDATDITIQVLISIAIKDLKSELKNLRKQTN